MGDLPLVLLREHLRLTGEDIVRITTGNVVRPPRGLVITVCGKQSANYHRVKFALANGWWPTEVDHRDGDRQNNLLSNYRPATRQEQNRNRGPFRRKHALPRGVYPSGNRFRAMVQEGEKLRSLGSYDTPYEAAIVVRDFLKHLHGDFYRDHDT